MNLHITKSKNAESFYIAKSYTKANGKTSSVIVRKLGTLSNMDQPGTTFLHGQKMKLSLKPKNIKKISRQKLSR